MCRATRTVVELALVIMTLGATIYGCFLVMNRLGPPRLFIVAIISATTLLVALAAIEGYCTG